MEIYVVDTLIRRRRFVEAGTKKKAEVLARAIIDGSVESLERPELVDGSEILAGVYPIDQLDEQLDEV